MERKIVNVVVAGHVDHGKSTLIGRLLFETAALPQSVQDRITRLQNSDQGIFYAAVTDQLLEEQTQRITIDTTSIQFKTAKRDYVFIDTPGHKELLKNMLTGTSHAHAAILLIDAAEGVVQTTYLHAFLIAMLGIRQIIVVVNKMDLVEYNQSRFAEITDTVAVYLHKLDVQIVATIPVSAAQGQNITVKSNKMRWDINLPLLKSLDLFDLSLEPPAQPLRFIVQCPYGISENRIILGKVTSGKLYLDQEIMFAPSMRSKKVRTITISGNSVSIARNGDSAALFLSNADDIDRGAVGFNRANPPKIATRIKALLFWIDAQPLVLGDPIEFICGTQHRSARIVEIDNVVDPANLAVEKREPLIRETQIAHVTIQSDSPVCIDLFKKLPELGRIALIRDNRIAGGAVILD